MFLVKRFKCLLVAFLLLSASPTTLSHGQEYQSMIGANQTETNVCYLLYHHSGRNDPVSLLHGYLPVCNHSNLDHYQPVFVCVSSSDIY